MDVQTFLGVMQTIIGSLGVLGNGVVCVVIAKVPAMRTLTNAFIFNQAVIDFLGSFFMVLHSTIKAPSPLNENPALAYFECHIWNSTVFMWINFVASTLNLTALTTERYLAIVHPFKYLTLFGRKQAAAILVSVWLLAFCYKGTNVLYFEIVDRKCVFANLPKAVSLIWGIVAFLIEYLIPLVFMTFCYVHIIYQLKKSSSSIAPEPTTSQQGDNTMSGSLLRARRNTLKTLCIIFVTYTICWSPNQIAFFMFNLFGLQINFKGAFYYISLILVQLNCCVNPIIYSFKYKQFQKGVRVLLSSCFPKLAVNQESVTSVSTRIRQA